MWTRQLLKQNGKIAFQRNYWTCVLVCVLAGFLGGGLATSFNFNVSEEEIVEVMGNITLEELLRQITPAFLFVVILSAIIGLLVGVCVTTLVSNVVMVGNSRYFLENREHKTAFSQLFYGFQGGRYAHTVLVMFLRSLYLFGWYLLLFVPGIIKSYAYMLVPYILAENPELDRKRVFELSEQMMKGHKMEAFLLELSFFGWFVLSAFTGGILSIFYVNPYWYATFAEFYSAVKADAKHKGVFAESELPGVTFSEA